jgi:hypothetical protein
MTPYKNLDQNSNIVAYENGPNYIIVQFRLGYWKTYTYTASIVSMLVIEYMQDLAVEGKGLNSYITKYKPPYTLKR